MRPRDSHSLDPVTWLTLVVSDGQNEQQVLFLYDHRHDVVRVGGVETKAAHGSADVGDLDERSG